MRSATATQLANNSIEDQLKKCIESGDVDLPVLPAVATRVLELVNAEDSNAQQLAALIQGDQALAGHVMRMANSAAFSGAGKIQTLQQAIAKLGMRTLGQMAMTVSVGDALFDGDDNLRDQAGQLWKHALASAAWAREIARASRCNTELAYLGGLLHQVGKAVALRALLQIQARDAEVIDDIEREALLQRYHKVLGVNLARRWQLPEAVVESINYIDDYYGAPSSREVVMAVHGARLLASATLQQLDSEALSEFFAQHEIFRDLNFYEDELQQLGAKFDDVSDLVSQMTL